MQEQYDFIVIGSGPASVATLAALPKSAKIAVITGIGKGIPQSNIESKLAHAKIRTIAGQRNEPVGISNIRLFGDGGTLSVTSQIGGLASYWGQQFVRWLEHDPWPRSLFSSYQDYCKACDVVDALFLCSPNELSPVLRHPSGFNAKTPRLMVRAKSDPETSDPLLAMRNAFHMVCGQMKVRLLDVAALTIHNEPDGVTVHLSDGSVIFGCRIFVAAGVIGSLQLILSSFDKIKSARLRDHAPYIIQLLAWRRALSHERQDGMRHFNTLSLEEIKNGKVSLFASVYRMSKAPIGLSLAALGLPSWFPNRYPPKVVDLISPLQVWTQHSFGSYTFVTASTKAHSIIKPDPENDPSLLRFIDALAKFGSILKLSKTPAGGGFHYHRGEISFDGYTYQGLSSWLSAEFDGRIECIDGSMIEELGCRPHTMTLMASAWKYVQNHCQKHDWFD